MFQSVTQEWRWPADVCAEAPAGIEEIMRTASNRSLVFLLAGTMATVLAGMLLAPPVARAECGDYLVLGAKAKSTAHSHLPPPLPATSQQMPVAGHDGPKPCSGPMCSKAPLPFPPMPPSPAPERGNEAAIPALLQHLAETQHFNCCPDDSAERPVRRGAEIYHPPRS
jgi:hypothetical protein